MLGFDRIEMLLYPQVIDCGANRRRGRSTGYVSG